jgi:hypothetical protein
MAAIKEFFDTYEPRVPQPLRDELARVQKALTHNP